STGRALALFPAGDLPIGLPDADARSKAPKTQVRITRPFYLGVREVTQGEYEQVMNENPSKFSPRGEFRQAVAGQDTRDYPVENVPWNEAVAFFNRLSELEGLQPYYEP